MWNISIAQYSKKYNAVKERTLFRLSDYTAAKQILINHFFRPIYLWHDKAVELHNPYLAMIETQAYKNEYKKIND